MGIYIRYNRSITLEIKACVYVQLIFNKGIQTIQRERRVFSTNGGGTDTILREMSLDA